MQGGTNNRPVHIVIVCGMAPGPLRTGLADGSLGTFGILASAGTLRYDCVAPFPSVTPTSVATIATGLSPGHHGILGRAWYERKRDHVRHYDPMRDLAAPDSPVLDRRLTQAGKRLATVNIPIGCGGDGHGVGADDRQVARLTHELIRSGKAQVTISLLRDVDASAPEAGPDFAAPALCRADRALAHMLDAYGSSEDALARAHWIVVGDHGMSRNFPGRADPATVQSLDCRPLAGGRAGVLIVPNGRVAFVYLRKGATYDDLEHCGEELALKHGIDQIFWQANGWTCARHGDLEFDWKPGEGLRDARGHAWRVSGSGAALGLEIASGVLVESVYVDPMRRVMDLFDAPDAPDIVLTAAEGYEFSGDRPERGSHGSLSAQDSLVPLLSTGTRALPPHLRLQEVADLALGSIGLSSSHLGAAR